MSKHLASHGSRPRLQPVASRCEWKVGLDLGSVVTAYHEIFSNGETVQGPRGLFFPSAIGYPAGMSPGSCDDPFEVFVGDHALESCEVRELVFPFAEEGERRRHALVDFARRLRCHMSSTRPGTPWGVLAYPPGASSQSLRELRAVANEIFERTLFVDEARLLALGMYNELRLESSILVDLGATSTRFFLQSGSTPIDDTHVQIDIGGNDVDEALHRSIELRYPDLQLSRATVRQLKEHLSFVGPVERRCTLNLTLGPTMRPLDVTALLRPACERLVGPVVRGLRRVIQNCPSDLVEDFLQNIYLVGGGARICGLARRVQDELHGEGVDLARVRSVPASQSVVAIGALKWSLTVPDDDWSIPLFSYGF